MVETGEVPAPARLGAPGDEEDVRGGRCEEQVIDVRDLRMRYGTSEVLDGVSLSVGPGEVVALLGPNGAGKTTTIEIMEGFRRPSSGRVSVLGTDPARAGEDWRVRVGVVLQSWRDHGRWRVAELLRHIGRYYRPYSTPERPRPRPVDELLETVGLADRASAKISTLSGGERRRMDLAIGIIGRPEVLFLDEPTAGLDPVARRGFHDLVHRLSDLENTTVILATHDLDEAEKLADRIVILDQGRVVADGSADRLARRVSSRAEVRWSLSGEHFVHTTTDATRYVRELFAQHGGDLADLEVRRASLEDAYMAIVLRRETDGPADRAPAPIFDLDGARR